jgi:hypothetical protein
MTETHPFRAAVEARDLDAIVDLLARGVVLNSPVNGLRSWPRPILGQRTRVRKVRVSR